jgi:hypothetical protein
MTLIRGNATSHFTCMSHTHARAHAHAHTQTHAQEIGNFNYLMSIQISLKLKPLCA